MAPYRKLPCPISNAGNSFGIGICSCLKINKHLCSYLGRCHPLSVNTTKIAFSGMCYTMHNPHWLNQPKADSTPPPPPPPPPPPTGRIGRKRTVYLRLSNGTPLALSWPEKLGAPMNVILVINNMHSRIRLYISSTYRCVYSTSGYTSFDHTPSWCKIVSHLEVIL